MVLPISRLESHYSLNVMHLLPLEPGEESRAWRLETNRGFFVLMDYPAWRTPDECAWVHHLVSGIARTVPEAVAPVAALDDSTLLVDGGRLFALFPYLEGVPLDRENSRLRAVAASLLARIHRAGLSLSLPGPRPPSGPNAPSAWPRPPCPPELADPALDALLGHLEAGARPLITGPIHGDYYRRNILCRRELVAGVIDWMEARVTWLVRELAWSTWEFAKSSSGDRLLPDRAQDFLDTYLAAGGPVPWAELDLVIPFIRARLRDEVGLYLAARERGLDWDAEYAEEEIRAFNDLRR